MIGNSKSNYLGVQGIFNLFHMYRYIYQLNPLSLCVQALATDGRWVLYSSLSGPAMGEELSKTFLKVKRVSGSTRYIYICIERYIDIHRYIDIYTRPWEKSSQRHF